MRNRALPPPTQSHFTKENPISDFMNSRKRGTPRTANDLSEVWKKRTELVKLQINAESAANDAKTARLKALRLEKEAQDAEAARTRKN